MIRSYSELRRYKTLEERFRYLSLNGEIGMKTFGFDRYVNQQFYRSRQWKLIRNDVIARDNGCDLGIEGYDIHRRILIHHMNPLRLTDIDLGDPSILDPNYLITTAHQTHNAIHYGDETLLPKPPVERRPGDTRLW